MANVVDNTLRVNGREDRIRAFVALFDEARLSDHLLFYPGFDWLGYEASIDYTPAAYEQDGNRYAGTPRQANIYFATNWTPPVETIGQIAAQHPDLTFEYRYESFDSGFRGGLVIPAECEYSLDEPWEPGKPVAIWHIDYQIGHEPAEGNNQRHAQA